MASKRKAPEALTSKTPKKATSITSFFASNGSNSSSSPSSSGPATSASKFDKDKWAAGLTPEQRDLLQLEINTLHPTWLAELREEVVKPSFLALKKFLKREMAEKTIYPKAEDIYSWSRHTPLNTVKVLILGQDPYHGPNQAMGMSFSVRPPTPAPPSLKNMYKTLAKDYPAFKPPPNNSGDLSLWADRGVLMLNACLTVRAANANSHQGKGWEPFTTKVIELVAQKRKSGVVFMAWGKYAQDRMNKLDKQRHLVLNSVHPSPLSAHRGFFDCGHFKKANEWLVTRYGPDGGINWALHGPPVGAKGKPEPEKKPEEPVAAKNGAPKPDDEDEFGLGDEEEEAFKLLAIQEAEKATKSGKVEADEKVEEPAKNAEEVPAQTEAAAGSKEDKKQEEKEGTDDSKIEEAKELIEEAKQKIDEAKEKIEEVVEERASEEKE